MRTRMCVGGPIGFDGCTGPAVESGECVGGVIVWFLYKILKRKEFKYLQYLLNINFIHTKFASSFAKNPFQAALQQVLSNSRDILIPC